MSAKDNPCYGCKYFDCINNSAPNGPSALNACMYICYTGHARSLICPPGEKCTVKTVAPRKRRRKAMQVARR